MGGDTIENLEKILDSLLLALQNDAMMEVEKYSQMLFDYQFSSLSQEKLHSVSKRVEYIIGQMEEKKNKKFEALQKKENLKKYRF